MKNIILIFQFFLLFNIVNAQPVPNFQEKVVYSGPDVVFRQIDEHTWVGTGKVMFNESLYLIEGNEKALLLDAGTKIENLDQIVASITDKPVTLIATHVHPDHTGSAIDYFPEIYINEADTVNVPLFMPNYKGVTKYLFDGQVFDLGDRLIEVVFTPGHTPGSTTFIDKAAHYGFSADAFGSGNLLITTTFSTLLTTCEKVSAVMNDHQITKLYPGHYFGSNPETKQRIEDLIILCKGALSGEIVGNENPQGMLGLNLVISDYGVRINYNEKALK